MTRELSPFTGWTRQDWGALADRMLLAVRPHASPDGALITLPGRPGGYGSHVDGLEGFARTFLLAGFRLAGEAGDDPLGLAEFYARGLAAGTDPSSPNRWVRPDEHGQAKVEAASLALILDMTRPWIWDLLDDGVQERIVDYLAPVVGDPTYPRINWVWFRVVVEQFLASVGGPWSLDDMEEDLATHESFVREGGWYADGDQRAFDHYTGWALHLYPVLWSRMHGADALAGPRQDAYRQRLDAYLGDAIRLVGADGSPLLQGRSLVYRFAAAAPFWAGALAGTTAVSPGRLRRAASGIVSHFVDHGVPDDDGLLTLGWHHEWRPMAQRYSGPGSPYWAAKGMLGLALPADHAVWTAVEEALPVEEADQLDVFPAPGWIVSSTVDDGVVRIHNHGTDHARPGDDVGDSPLYARLGYSTVTSPQMDEDGWTAPTDQSVVLLDAAGRATHRTGFVGLPVEAVTDGPGASVALASVARCHWLVAEDEAPDHGSGRSGDAVEAAAVTTVSVVNGPWEVRAVRIDGDEAPGRQEIVALRVGGWPVSGPADVVRAGASADGAMATARTPSATSRIVGLSGDTHASVTLAADATPLGAWTATPVVLAEPAPIDSWFICVVALMGGSARQPGAWTGDVHVEQAASQPTIRIVWPDRLTTTRVRVGRTPADVHAPDHQPLQHV